MFAYNYFVCCYIYIYIYIYTFIHSAKPFRHLNKLFVTFYNP